MAILDSLRGGPAGRSNILDRLGSGQPVDPAEREQRDQLTIQEMGEFRKGLRRAAYNAGVTSRAAVAGLAEPFAPEFSKQQFAKAEEAARSQPEYLNPAVAGFDEVNGLRSAVQYATGALGEGLASTVPAIAGALATRGATFRAAPAVQNAASLVGGAAAAFPMEAGESALALQQNPEAMANTTPWERAGLTAFRGGASGLLESAFPTGLIAGTTRRIAPGAMSALANVGRKTAAGVVGEGATEASQELLGQAIENYAAPSTGYDPKRIAEAAVRGAITGGTLGAGGGTVQAARSNITAGVERAQDAAIEKQDFLNAAVEKIDYAIRNPEQVGEDLTNATLGSIADAVSRAEEIGGQLEEAAGPAAARGMEAVSAMRQQLDRGIVRQLTPENKKKYTSLTKRFRFLQPTEYKILRDALESGDGDRINKAVGIVAGSLSERVPRETLQGIKNLGRWGKKFTAGVTNAARDRKAAFRQITPGDIEEFRAYLRETAPEVLTKAVYGSENPQGVLRMMLLARDIMTPTDPRTEIVTRRANKTEPTAEQREGRKPMTAQLSGFMKDFEAATGHDFRKVVQNSIGWQRDNPSRAAKEELYASSTGDSQMGRMLGDMESGLTEDVQEEYARRGIEIGPGAVNSGVDITEYVPENTDTALGAAFSEAYKKKGHVTNAGERMNEEDQRTTPFSNPDLIRRIAGVTRRDGERLNEVDPKYTIPAILRPENPDDLGPQQLAMLFGGKDLYRDPSGKFRQRPAELSEAEIASRITEDGGYRQDLNTIDMVAQMGTPEEDGGSREAFQDFVPDFGDQRSSRGLGAKRLISALVSLNADGIQLKREDIPDDVILSMKPEGIEDAAWLKEWRARDGGRPIKIGASVQGDEGSGSYDDIASLINTDLVVRRERSPRGGRPKEITLADELGMNRAGRSLEAQITLLRNIPRNVSGVLRLLSRGQGDIRERAIAGYGSVEDLARKRVEGKGGDFLALPVEEQLAAIEDATPSYERIINERVRQLIQTAKSLNGGLWNFAAEQEELQGRDLNELTPLQQARVKDGYAPRYLEQLVKRKEDAATRQLEGDIKRAITRSIRDGNISTGDVYALLDLFDTQVANEEAPAEQGLADVDFDVTAWLTELGIDYSADGLTNSMLYDILSSYTNNELLEVEQQEQAYEEEPTRQERQSPDEEYGARRMSAEGRESTLRLKGVDKGVDARKYEYPMTVDNARKMLEVIPKQLKALVEERIPRRDLKEQLELPFPDEPIMFRGLPFYSLTHIWESYNRPNAEDNSGEFTFNEREYLAGVAEYEKNGPYKFSATGAVRRTTDEVADERKRVAERGVDPRTLKDPQQEPQFPVVDPGEVFSVRTGWSRELATDLAGAKTEEAIAAVRQKYADRDMDIESRAGVEQTISEHEVALRKEAEEAATAEGDGTLVKDTRHVEHRDTIEIDGTAYPIAGRFRLFGQDFAIHKRPVGSGWQVSHETTGEPIATYSNISGAAEAGVAALKAEGRDAALARLGQEQAGEADTTLSDTEALERLRAVKDIPELNALTLNEFSPAQRRDMRKNVAARAKELAAEQETVAEQPTPEPAQPAQQEQGQEEAGAEAFVAALLRGDNQLPDTHPYVQTVKGWADTYLDGEEVRVVEFDPEDSATKAYFGATNSRGIVAGRTIYPGTLGKNSPATILVKKVQNKGDAAPVAGAHVVAHEFGHLIHRMAYPKAPQAVKDAVMRGYERDVKNKRREGRVAEAIRGGMSPIRALASTVTRDNANLGMSQGEADAHIGAKVGRFAEEGGTTVDYMTSEAEYFAEQFAQYALREPSIFAGANEEVRSWLDGLLAKIREFYETVIRPMSNTAPEFDDFMRQLKDGFQTEQQQAQAATTFDEAGARAVFAGIDSIETIGEVLAGMRTQPRFAQHTEAITRLANERIAELQGRQQSTDQTSARREGETNAEYVRRMKQERADVSVAEQQTSTPTTPASEPVGDWAASIEAATTVPGVGRAVRAALKAYPDQNEAIRAAGAERTAAIKGRNVPRGTSAEQGQQPATGRVTYQKRITRQDLRSNPRTLYVFGDNMTGKGLGGQAKEMRGEPNAVGIPTKRFPSMNANAFFTDKDFDAWFEVANKRFERLKNSNQPIVWPADGIGTGLAKLKENAPRIWNQIEAWRKELSQEQQTPPARQQKSGLVTSAQLRERRLAREQRDAQQQQPTPEPAPPTATGDWAAAIAAAPNVIGVGDAMRQAIAANPDQTEAISAAANARIAELKKGQQPRRAENAPRGTSAARTSEPAGRKVTREELREIRLAREQEQQPPAPPQEPPTPPQKPTPPPPPPPDNDAMKRFREVVQRLLGNRVDVKFNEDLPDGVAAEWDARLGESMAETGKALRELQEQRRSALRTIKRKESGHEQDGDEMLSIPELRDQIANYEQQMEKYREDLAVRGTIRVATGMETQAGLAEHEAFHAAFEIFFGDHNADDRKIIATAFTRGMVGRRLRNYFKDSPEVLAVIDPNSRNFKIEEAAAYGFQVYLHDPQALQLGQQLEGIYHKVLAFLQRLVGYKTYEQRAKAILDDLNSGRRAERGASVLREHAGIEKSMLEKSQDFARSIGSSAMMIYDTVFQSAYDRLEGSGNPALAQIARLGYNETGKEGQGMIQRQRLATTQWSNRLKDALDGLNAEDLNRLNEAMLMDEPLQGRLKRPQEKLRSILDDMHTYQTEAGVQLGFQQDYFPMIWSPEKVANNRQAFIDMLNEYPENLRDMMKTAEEVADSITAFETRGHEFQGIFGKDGEPVADSSRRQTLGFVPRERRAEFMEDDIVTTMAHYINQATRHTEYVRAYGQNGERLNQLLSEVTNEYGGSKADRELAQDYIDGLMGNKEVGMSRELKDVYGAIITYQNVRLLPLSVFSSFVDPLGIAVRTGNMGAVFDTFAYSIRNIFTDFRKNWTPDQWAQFAGDMGTIDMSGTVKSVDKIYTGVTLRGKTREINDAFFKYNLLNGWVRNNHIMATKAAALFLRRSADGSIHGNQRDIENLQEVGLTKEDIVFDEGLGRIRATAPEILGYASREEMEQQADPEEIAEARAQADRIQQAIHKIVRQSMIQPSSAEMPNWMSNPYLAPIAHLKTFVFGFNATILERLKYEASRGNYSPLYYAAAYVPGMIAADFIKGLAGNGGEEPEWKKNWTMGDYVWYGVQRSGLTGTGQFFTDMGNDVVRGGGGLESLAGPSVEQGLDFLAALKGETSRPLQTWMVNSMPANPLYDQWMKP